MLEIPVDLPAELVPLSWLVGTWEGTGVIDYRVGDDTVTHEFGQRVQFAHDGQPVLQYSSVAWLLDAPDGAARELPSEIGYWRLARQLGDGDAGPGMLPASAPTAYGDAESVETLRKDAEGFDLQVQLVHPDGVGELYLGRVAGPRIDLATDAVVRAEGAKPYAAATRLYGLVESHLLWAWDIAALGQDLRTHASARLAKVG